MVISSAQHTPWGYVSQWGIQTAAGGNDVLLLDEWHTPIYDEFIPKADVDSALDGFNDFHPLGRTGTPTTPNVRQGRSFDRPGRSALFAAYAKGVVCGGVLPPRGEPFVPRAVPMTAGPAGPRATGYSARDGSPVREGKRDRHQQHPARGK